MIRYLPSTSSVSFDSACRLSRERALRAVFSAVRRARLAAFFSAFPLLASTASESTDMMSCSSSTAYQTSSVPIRAKPRIASR